MTYTAVGTDGPQLSAYWVVRHLRVLSIAARWAWAMRRRYARLGPSGFAAGTAEVEALLRELQAGELR
jgi:hypothetical protein